MQVEIIGKKSRTLKTVTHNGQVYVEAPAEGSYKIRLRNNSACRRLAVVSVDGVNVLDGKNAGIDGQGYVLRPWETIDIPGWRRSDSSVAKFQFTEQGGSYSAQTGRGTSNVGVIGVAVFDEQVSLHVPYTYTFVQAPVTYRHDLTPNIWNNNGGRETRMRSMSVKSMQTNIGGTNDSFLGMVAPTSSMQCNVAIEGNDSDGGSGERTSGGVGIFAATSAPVDVGTGYGKESQFHTTSTTFNRATTSPALLVSLRYATRERLLSWGVPIDDVQSAPKSPNPFPASYPAVPAPPGWQG